MIGETLRPQNFGLNGYTRRATPELAKRDVINFVDATACGSSTAVSLLCIFSSLNAAAFSRQKALSQENLVDALGHTGFQVAWFENNTGDMGVAKRLGWNHVDATLEPQACSDECTDEILLPVIEKTLAGMIQNTVLVLHMNGYHGPAYYMRYSENSAIFQLNCRTAQFSDCHVAEIINAYDNAIVETDQVLSRAIDLLTASDKVLPAMLFVSDHGGSLGENRLFLHAASRFMAPQEQTKVPMVIWLGDAFRATMMLDVAYLSDVASQSVSHDNLFHTVLGLLDITTAARETALDLTNGCRRSRLSNPWAKG